MCGWVEDPQRINFVTEEIDADWVGQVRRPDVDDAAAAGEGPGLLHDVHRLVRAMRPVLRQLIQLKITSGAQGPQGHTEGFDRKSFLHQRTGGGDDDRRALVFLLQGCQSGEAELTRAARPGDALVGQRVRLGIQRYRGRAIGRRQEQFQPLHPALGLLHSAGQYQDRARAVGGRRGDD